jgi:hypothetical protein
MQFIDLTIILSDEVPEICNRQYLAPALPSGPSGPPGSVRRSLQGLRVGIHEGQIDQRPQPQGAEPHCPPLTRSLGLPSYGEGASPGLNNAALPVSCLIREHRLLASHLVSLSLCPPRTWACRRVSTAASPFPAADASAAATAGPAACRRGEGPLPCSLRGSAPPACGRGPRPPPETRSPPRARPSCGSVKDTYTRLGSTPTLARPALRHG